MKIIVTGATGAFGAAILKYLAEAGHTLIATGRRNHPPPALTNIAEYIQADITEPFKLPEADVCIHAAALADDRAALRELYLPNVIGTKNVVEAANKCKKFIFISSSSVYLPQKEPLKEHLAGKQNNEQLSSYGKSKLASEEMLKKVYQGGQCFILRPRAFYGPGDTQIVPRLLKLVKKSVLSKPGKLDIQLSMTHYLNMAAAIECCLESDKKGISTYNVADEEVYVMIDVLRKITHALYGRSLDERQIPVMLLRIFAVFNIGGFTPLLVRGLTKNMTLDISKIQRELHYQPIITLDESLAELQSWVQRIGGVEVLRSADKSLHWKQ